MTPPPPVIASARIVEYAAIDSHVTLTGRTVRFLGGRAPGTAPQLAIGLELSGDGIRLMHCDEDWNTLSASEHLSIDGAKRAAEEVYSGVADRWVKTTFSEDEVAAFLKAEDQGLICSFCGRHPHEVTGIVLGHNGAAICDLCVREFRRRSPSG